MVLQPYAWLVDGFGICCYIFSKAKSFLLCGLKPVDLTNSTMQILGLHFSYNETLKNENKLSDTITKIENLLRVWRQRQLTLEGKITIFKTLAISKIVYNAYLSSVPESVIKALKKIQKDFLWNGKRAKKGMILFVTLMKRVVYKAWILI